MIFPLIHNQTLAVLFYTNDVDKKKIKSDRYFFLPRSRCKPPQCTQKATYRRYRTTSCRKRFEMVLITCLVFGKVSIPLIIGARSELSFSACNVPFSAAGILLSRCKMLIKFIFQTVAPEQQSAKNGQDLLTRSVRYFKPSVPEVTAVNRHG